MSQAIQERTHSIPVANVMLTKLRTVAMLLVLALGLLAVVELAVWVNTPSDGVDAGAASRQEIVTYHGIEFLLFRGLFVLRG